MKKPLKIAPIKQDKIYFCLSCDSACLYEDSVTPKLVCSCGGRLVLDKKRKHEYLFSKYSGRKAHE